MITRLFLVMLIFLQWKVFAQSNITAAEYFFDNDPGFGNATPLPSFTSSEIIDVNMTALSSGLSPGLHTFVVRVMDNANTWSLPVSIPFYVVHAVPDIVSAEYFIDIDPGFGNGILITGISPGETIDLSTLIEISSLSIGSHVLGLRTQSSNGTWSRPMYSPFIIDFNRSITTIEYFIDSDPGVGNAISVVVPDENTIDMEISINTDELAHGEHTIGVRVGRIDENWSTKEITDFHICTYATPQFTANTVCEGATTMFTDQSTNILVGDVYAWDFQTDGTTDDDISGNTSHNYTTNGVYHTTLTIDRTGCVNSFSLDVNVEPTPEANAGIDQSLCEDYATLAAVASGENETGSWSLIDGTGTITNPSDPTSTFTTITSYVNTLRWTVTNTEGGCSDFDEIQITSNQPIIANDISVQASIGQTASFDVQTIADINPGDVLITSILIEPSKGYAVVMPDGTINYSPDNGTVGADGIQFQICNQCERCSSNLIVIAIQNNAPVIQPSPITVGSESSLSVSLLQMISDLNNNLDLSSLAIITQPVSGAQASLDENYNLILDYTGVSFTGTDEITIQVCDMEGVCTTSVVFIDVDREENPPVMIYNAVSPNGDGMHDFLEIVNIESYPQNHVYIFNRWGDRVYEGSGYDNDRVKFMGVANVNSNKMLPSGTYFYSVSLGNGREAMTGFLVLKGN